MRDADQLSKYKGTFGMLCTVPPSAWVKETCLRGGGGGSPPFFPSHAALVRRVLSAAAANVPAGVVSASAKPSSWHTEVAIVVAEVVAQVCSPLPLALGSPTTFSALFPCAWPNCPTHPHGAPVATTFIPTLRGSRMCMAHSLMVACALRVVCAPLWLTRVACAPVWCPVWCVLHCGCAVVLGSAHPGFVKGSLPFLHHPDSPLCATGVPLVTSREGEGDDKGNSHQHQQPTHGHPCPPTPPRVPSTLPSVPLPHLFAQRDASPTSMPTVEPAQVSGRIAYCDSRGSPVWCVQGMPRPLGH